jgi:hypothetical protein
VWRSYPPPPPPVPPHEQPPDEEAEYDEDGALKPEFHGSWRGTNPSDDAHEGYPIDMRHPENILPKKALLDPWALFTKIERVEETEDEMQERKQKYDAAQEAKAARRQLLESVMSKWCLQTVPRSKWGRKLRAELFNDALRAHVTQLVADGATAATFAGPKPSLPNSCTPKVRLVLVPALVPAPASPAFEHRAPPVEQEQPKSKRGSEKGVKRGPYKTSSDKVNTYFGISTEILATPQHCRRLSTSTPILPRRSMLNYSDRLQKKCR